MNNRAWFWLGWLACTLMWATSAVFHTMIYHKEQPEITHTPRPEFGTLPPDCGHLYNVDKHKEWAACIGVDYRTALMRKDI